MTFGKVNAFLCKSHVINMRIEKEKHGKSKQNYFSLSTDFPYHLNWFFCIVIKKTIMFLRFPFSKQLAFKIIAFQDIYELQFENEFNFKSNNNSFKYIYF